MDHLNENLGATNVEVTSTDLSEFETALTLRSKCTVAV